MYLKRKATVLISTIIILSLMSGLGCFMFKMMKNNTELANLYNFHKDIYDFSKDEEEILYKFMDGINRDRENNSEEDKFPVGLYKSIGESTISYDNDKKMIILKTRKDSETTREREITYSFRNKKIILVPTYKFICIDE